MARKKGAAARELLEPWREQRRPGGTPVRSGRATFHLPAHLLEEVRDTVVALSGPPLQLTMSKFAANALRRELDRLRNRRAGDDRGKPFEERSAPVRRGRPIR